MRRSNWRVVERPRRIEKVWTIEETKKLVENIESKEAIWDPDSTLYKNRVVRQKIWSVVAEATTHSVSDAKNYWNNLRCRFNTERKKEVEFMSKYPGEKFKSNFEFYLAMQFLTKSPKGNLKVEDLDFDMQNVTSLTSLSQAESDLEYNHNSDETKKIYNEYAALNTTEIGVSSCTNESKQIENNDNSSKNNSKHFLTDNEVTNFPLDPLTCVSTSVKKFRKRRLIKPQESVTNRKWKEVFSEYILCELDRYEYHDAQSVFCFQVLTTSGSTMSAIYRAKDSKTVTSVNIWCVATTTTHPHVTKYDGISDRVCFLDLDKISKAATGNDLSLKQRKFFIDKKKVLSRLK